MLCSVVKRAGSGSFSLPRLIRTKRQVKVASPEESGRIATNENVLDFSNGIYERSSKFGDENAKCGVVFERSYSYLGLYLLAVRLPELTSKLERIDCSHLFNSEHRSKLSTDYSSGE